MTRLTTGDLDGLAGDMQTFDRELSEKTGCILRQLACLASGIPEGDMLLAARKTPVAVVPVTAGRGVITGFAETVRAVAAHLGFPARVTGSTDVAGLAEALEGRSEILLLADDLRYVAVHTRTLSVADNTPCTASGFVIALELMAGSLSGREVLLLGCGAVGEYACRYLLARGAKVAAYDPQPQKSLRLARELAGGGRPTVKVEAEPGAALLRCKLIYDASPAAGIIDAGCVSGETCVSAPGVPSGVTPAAREILGRRYLHDPLRIGTAVMLVTALTQAGH